MDQKSFEKLTRDLATEGTRRSIVKRLGALVVGVGLLGARKRAASADHCNWVGCGCATGVYHACGNGLVCCSSTPGTPGGAGVCSYPSDCGNTCNGAGQYCGNSCNWGDNCPACCSGYCGDTGQCTGGGSVRCTSAGCTCATGTYAPCDDGLSCCSSNPGMPGAPGTCQASC